MVEQRPWDFLTIPIDKTTKFNKYIPVSYGDFFNNTSTEASPDYCNGISVRPCPVLNLSNKLWSMSGERDFESGVVGHFYDKSIQRFIPIKDTDTETTTAYGGEMFGIPKEVRISAKWKPSSVGSTTDSDWSAQYDAFNGDSDDTTNYAYVQKTSGLSDGLNIFVLELESPRIAFTNDSSGSYRLFYEIDWEISATTLTGNPTNAYIAVGHQSPITSIAQREQAEGVGTESGTYTGEVTSDTLSITATFNKVSGGQTKGTVKINDVRLYVSSEVIWDDEQNAKKAIDDIEMLYTGADGLEKSWSSGTIATIHEAHRDILYRYTGYTDTPTNWSSGLDIVTNRADWKLRWWALEPIEVQKALEKLQKEGCFIFLWSPDGTGKYIYVESSYSASDVVHTLTNQDITGLEVKNTPFSQLLTKMTVNYEKHPAESKSMSSYTFENTSARSDWNIQTKENIKEENLEALVSTTTSPTDDVIEGYWDYYNNIFGDVRLKTSGSIVNPKMYDLEVGDVVQFDLDTKPFGYTWSDKYMMITSLTRTPGSLKFEAREVYST